MALDYGKVNRSADVLVVSLLSHEAHAASESVHFADGGARLRACLARISCLSIQRHASQILSLRAEAYM